MEFFFTARRPGIFVRFCGLRVGFGAAGVVVVDMEMIVVAVRADLGVVEVAGAKVGLVSASFVVVVTIVRFLFSLCLSRSLVSLTTSRIGFAIVFGVVLKAVSLKTISVGGRVVRIARLRVDRGVCDGEFLSPRAKKGSSPSMSL